MYPSVQHCATEQNLRLAIVVPINPLSLAYSNEANAGAQLCAAMRSAAQVPLVMLQIDRDDDVRDSIQRPTEES